MKIIAKNSNLIFKQQVPPEWIDVVISDVAGKAISGILPNQTVVVKAEILENTGTVQTCRPYVGVGTETSIRYFEQLFDEISATPGTKMSEQRVVMAKLSDENPMMRLGLYSGVEVPRPVGITIKFSYYVKS